MGNDRVCVACSKASGHRPIRERPKEVSLKIKPRVTHLLHLAVEPLSNGTSVCLVDGQHQGEVATHRDVTAPDVESECRIVLLFGL